MCGIAGIFNLNGEPASAVILRKMTDIIAHRGPDGEGFYTDSFIGLAHRRLSIIDLTSAGHQPMVTKDGMYVITYNGEVYNFQELRVQLESCGHQFHSKTDTEVVLKAYAQWGEKCLDKFNGMFAFAIWDKKKQELFLARDRYGIKPLYYTLVGNTFIFASEIKAILQHPSYRIDLDKEALLEYFTFQNFFTEKTLFKNIHTMPAGTIMRITLAINRTPLCKQYWDFDFSESEKPKDEKEYIEELDRLFQQAVIRQLVSDVDIGSYLSGGMDSGSITAIAATQLPYIRTFTGGFDLSSVSGMEMGFDERSKAEHMSYIFKTEHYEMVMKAGDMERCMPRLVRHLEEPRVGQSYPNYYVSQLASKFLKVILSGTGGDEMFGGYPWRYYRAVVNNNFEQYVDKYYEFWQRLIPNHETKQVFNPIWKDINHIKTRDIFKNVFKSHSTSLTSPKDYINNSLYFEAKTFLHGLLIMEDKLSMAHSLETRVPFLDNDLVDFAMHVPVGLKLGNLGEVSRLNENEPGPKREKYFKKTKDGKLLLRKAMSRHIPLEISNGIKQGFSAPDASWFKGDSIEYVKKMIYNKSSKMYDYLDRDTVQRLANEHVEGKQNRRLFIWSLIYLENWCNIFLH